MTSEPGQGFSFVPALRNALGQLVPAKIFCLHSWRGSGGAGLRRGEVDALGTLALGTSKTDEGFPGSSDGKESACSAGDSGSVPGLGRFLDKEIATHSSILAWRVTVHGVVHKELGTTEQLTHTHTHTHTGCKLSISTILTQRNCVLPWSVLV